MKIFKSLLVLIILCTQGVISEPLLKFSAAQIQSINIPINLNTKIVQGHHKVIDEVGNEYYYVNNTDIGNPTENGYGDFKVYYKNGHRWEFTFDGEKVQGVMYFMTLDKAHGSLPKGSVVFCVQPTKEAEWIDDTNAGNSSYNDLSKETQVKVNKVVALAIDEFSSTGNFDYLTAGQMLVWEAVGAKFTSYDSSVKKEKEDLEKKLENYDVAPSFAGQSVELKYNKDNKRYETVIEDTNEVLDEKYLSTIIGQYDDVHIENGPSTNDLYIWSKNEFSNEMLISGKYNPMPSTSGTKLGIYYNTTPKFVNSGQDLVTGLSYDSIFSFFIKLNPARGKASLKKCGFDMQNNCNKLAGITFGLYDEEDNLIEQKKTDSAGEIIFDNIPLGNYYIKELKTQDKYEINKQKYNFSITYDNQEVKINEDKYIENKLIKGRVKLTKVGQVNNNDSNLYPLKGVEFTIYKDLNKNGTLEENEINEIVQKLYTDTNGNIISNDLEYGNYIIKETKPLEGYINNGYEECFQIKTNGQVINLYGGMDLENKLIKGKVDLYKTSDINYKECRTHKQDCLTNENLLQGVRFGIYEDINNNQKLDKTDIKVQTLTTNEKGYAISGYLRYGSYILKEEQTITGYEMTDEIFPFKITTNNEIVHINNGKPIINSAKKSKIKVIKEDEEGSAVSGVKFGLYQDINHNQKLDEEEENLLVDEIITNESGEGESKDLNYGDYILKELQTPEQYMLSEEQIPITIDDTIQEDIKIKVVNQFKRGNIKIIKKDKEENLLKDAVFEIYKDENLNKKIDESDQLITKISTNNLGEAIVEDLIYGQYLIKEVSSPDGYILSNKLYNVNIDENQKEYEVEVYNSKIPERLVITSQNIWKYIIILIIFINMIGIFVYKKINKRKNYI